MSQDEEGIDLVRLTLTICGAIIVAGLGYKVMKLVGIIPDFTSNRLQNQSELTPELYLSNPSKKTINGATAIDLMEDLKDAKGIVNDNEASVINAIQMSGSKYNMSFIAKLYGDEYNESLVTHLDSFTNQQERKDIIRASNNLPKS
jgi:hypothetical protein